jgi:hypothetical protein
MCHVSSMAVFVGNLLSVVLVLFPDIFVNICLQFRWPPMVTGMTKRFMFHILEFLYLDFYILISFQLPFVLYLLLLLLLLLRGAGLAQAV